jgi:hypothetical protein
MNGRWKDVLTAADPQKRPPRAREPDAGLRPLDGDGELPVEGGL